MSEKNQNNAIYLLDYLVTPENVNQNTLSQFQADMVPGLLKKILAFGIDFTAILFLKFLVTISYASFVENFLFMLNYQQMIYLVNANFTFTLSLTFLIYYSYFLFCNYALSGKTLGKLVFKISTIGDNFIFNVKEDDISMSLSQAHRRAIGYLVCYISFGTFFIFSFFSEDKRGLQDFFSGTRTVNDKWIDSMKDYKRYGVEVVTIDILDLDRAA